MPRNLDLTAMRSFVAVADEGGVTRAAAVLNLTQSAVSMQLKRLEESLDVALMDRSARTIAVTPQGEQLLSFARRMLALNDEALRRLTAQEFEGEITLGVPHDIIYPALPKVLQAFAAEYPRMKVNLVSSFTSRLKDLFSSGGADIILTTEDVVDAGGDTLTTKPLVWVGAPGGHAWKQRPLRLAFETNCIFRKGVQRRLDAAGIDWELAVDTDSSRTVEATVSADLAVHTMIAGSEPPYFERIDHGQHLPALRQTRINMYSRDGADDPAVLAMGDMIRRAYVTTQAV